MTSRPLPIIEIERPSAERGADDVRALLDATPCQLCGCPGADEVTVEIPWTGKTGRRAVCRGHPEHPDHPGYAERENPTDYRFCERCGEPGPWVNGDGLCHNCRMGFDDAEIHEYLDDARTANSEAAAGNWVEGAESP